MGEGVETVAQRWQPEFWTETMDSGAVMHQNRNQKQNNNQNWNRNRNIMRIQNRIRRDAPYTTRYMEQFGVRCLAQVYLGQACLVWDSNLQPCGHKSVC